MRLAGLRRPSLKGNRGAPLPRPRLLSTLLLWGWAAMSHCCCGSEGLLVAEQALVLAEDNKYPSPKR
ncbi:hypothetical protein BDA96_08G051000 [Sorghum bicolor]|uniref:Uncharacterized protein n=2 Tax=Sorghum bicolor TaxID=4558 RepID=A0A921QG42_SORBI|nr:hypothetical protein BDA96_09G022700 [Sorghum bicolor]KAG0520177.1 hypothetical protein BDA96_08G051000 [Sorghum bicolor]KXG23032.1 hypothetical protein SORBI_3008G047200 [Sorghum bicolor]